MDNVVISYVFSGFIIFMYFVNIISGWKAKAAELDALKESKRAVYVPSASELIHSQRERQATAFAVAFFLEARKFVEWFGKKTFFQPIRIIRLALKTRP